MDATTALTWLILMPLVASPVIYLAGRLSHRFGNDHASPAQWLAVLALLLDFYPLYIAWQALGSGAKLTLVLGQVALKFDGISLLMAAVVLVLGLMVTLFSAQYMAKEEGEEKLMNPNAAAAAAAWPKQPQKETETTQH